MVRDYKAFSSEWLKGHVLDREEMSWSRLVVAYQCTYLNHRTLTSVDRILDAGCGAGFLVRYLEGFRDAVRYVGLDSSWDSIAEARVRFPPPFLLGDVRQLPFKADAFDVAYCRDVVIHHLAPYEAIAELYRVASAVLLRIRTAEIAALFTARYREREIIHHFFPLDEVLNFLETLVPVPRVIRYAVYRRHPRAFDVTLFENYGEFSSYFVTDLFIVKGRSSASAPHSVRVIDDTTASALLSIVRKLTGRRSYLRGEH